MSYKKVMREVSIKICDYCGKEITDYNWSGANDMDFHSMKAGGEFGLVKETCWEKHYKKIDVNVAKDEVQK